MVDLRAIIMCNLVHRGNSKWDEFYCEMGRTEPGNAKFLVTSGFESAREAKNQAIVLAIA
jgi:hypothetical protein